MLIVSTYHMLHPILATSDEKALCHLSYFSNRTMPYVTMHGFSVGREMLPGANLGQCSNLLHNEDPVQVGYFLYDGVERHDDVSDRNGCGNSSVCLSKDARESPDDSMYLSPMN